MRNKNGLFQVRGTPRWLLPKDPSTANAAPSLATGGQTAAPLGPRAVAAQSSEGQRSSICLQPLAAPLSVACVGGDDDESGHGDDGSSNRGAGAVQAWDPASFRWFWRMAHEPLPPPPTPAELQPAEVPSGASGAGGAVPAVSEEMPTAVAEAAAAAEPTAESTAAAAPAASATPAQAPEADAEAPAEPEASGAGCGEAPAAEAATEATASMEEEAGNQ